MADHVLGRTLSDLIRAQKLGLIAAVTTERRECCSLPERGTPVAKEESLAICVLKKVGCAYEEKRGKWSFYSLDREVIRGLLGEAAEYLGVTADPSGKV
jgi:ArsR family transcriptional regulator, arsenate/arsenite/antimonite-responsive transcriptional repressor